MLIQSPRYSGKLSLIRDFVKVVRVTSSTNDISLALLADHPELIPTLAAWFHREWGHISTNRTPEHYARLLRDNLNRDRVPLTLVAFANGKPIGTASLDSNDLDTQTELSPWLASVVVAPDARGKGIGTKLINGIESEAKRLSITKLYLWTEHSDALYARLGWIRRGVERYHATDIVIMEKTLSPVATA